MTGLLPLGRLSYRDATLNTALRDLAREDFMDCVRKLPNIMFPVSATALALLGLAICLMTMSLDSPVAWCMIWMVVLFIGSAMLHWMNYLRQYIDFRIEKAMQEVVLQLKADSNSHGAPQQ